MHRRFMTMIANQGAVNPLNAGVTCPAITPTLGAELLANPGFEGTYDNEGSQLDVAPNWSNSGADAGADTLAESATAHGGSKSQRIAVGTAGEGIVTDATSLTLANAWHQISAWVNITSGVPRITDSGGRISNVKSTPTGEWTQIIATGRTTVTDRTFMVRAATTTATDFLVDDASAKVITLASMMTRLGTLSGRNGTYICHPTVAFGTQAGMVIAYLNATNFVLAVVDRLTPNGTAGFDVIRLLKYINGTWTEVINAVDVGTYAAGGELKVVVSGTGYSLYYAGVQMGTQQTISDTLGEDVYGFTAYSGNSVGVVTANP